MSEDELYFENKHCGVDDITSGLPENTDRKCSICGIHTIAEVMACSDTRVDGEEYHCNAMLCEKCYYEHLGEET